LSGEGEKGKRGKWMDGSDGEEERRRRRWRRWREGLPCQTTTTKPNSNSVSSFPLFFHSVFSCSHNKSIIMIDDKQIE
jgi:hypothetical protein